MRCIRFTTIKEAESVILIGLFMLYMFLYNQCNEGIFWYFITSSSGFSFVESFENIYIHKQAAELAK